MKKIKKQKKCKKIQNQKMPRYNLFNLENKLSPSGWFLTFILTFYVLAGLIGKDPWKGEDAIHINVAWQILQTGNWKDLTLAGEPFNAPPLYYWSAAIFGKMFSQDLAILSLHDAIRLASGFWLSLSLVALYYGAREQFGDQAAAAAPLLLAGCIGLIIHSHDAQPMLIALAAYSTALSAIFISPRKPILAALFLTFALLSSFLGVGILLTLPIILLAISSIFLFYFSNQKANVLNSNLNLNEQTLDVANLTIVAIFVGILVALIFLGIFLRFDLVNFESIQINFNTNNLELNLNNLKLLELIDLFAWFLFPVLPLAICGLFYQQRKLNFSSIGNINSINMSGGDLFDNSQPDISKILLVILWISTSFLIIFSEFFTEISAKSDELLALLLLPGLSMLATIGVLNLRRGAIAAFDWFAITCFSIFCGFVWVCWSAMRFGFPAKLSQRIYILRPGFVPENFFDTSVLILFILAICATLYWLYLLLNLSEKSPYRCLTRWTLGLTIFWFLAACLVISWFDYGKSYRPVGEGIVQTLSKYTKNSEKEKFCLAEIGLTATQRASLSYFTNIVKIEKINPLVKTKNNTRKTCNYVVISGEKNKQNAAKFGYNVKNILWEGKRKRERFYLLKK